LSPRTSLRTSLPRGGSEARDQLGAVFRRAHDGLSAKAKLVADLTVLERDERIHDMTENAHLHALVSGRVQGVNFRYYTIREASRLGVTGWVANRRDGKVECVAEGPRSRLEEMLDFLHQGSPSAHVTNVEASWGSPTGEFAEFKVRYL
jgi:acylphosphatase